jgi:hypothetical protein
MERVRFMVMVSEWFLELRLSSCVASLLRCPIVLASTPP